MRVKDITQIAILSASLTAGKLVLSVVPNIEIVTFLLITFTVLFGFRKAMITSLIFVTTDVLLYGFGTWILGYYFVWPLLIVLTHFLSKISHSEYVFASLAGAFGLCFGLLFAMVESIFYGVEYGVVYWIRGIPFDIIHGLSNFIIVLILFKPLTKTIKLANEKMNIL